NELRVNYSIVGSPLNHSFILVIGTKSILCICSFWNTKSKSFDPILKQTISDQYCDRIINRTVIYKIKRLAKCVIVVLKTFLNKDLNIYRYILPQKHVVIKIANKIIVNKVLITSERKMV